MFRNALQQEQARGLAADFAADDEAAAGVDAAAALIRFIALDESRVRQVLSRH